MIDLAETKRLAFIAGAASIILLTISLFAPLIVLRGFAFVALIPVAWLCLFWSSTTIASALRYKTRRLFQIGISVIVPAALSIYFIKDTATVTFEGTVNHMFSVSFILVLVFIGYISWAAGDGLDKHLPFRGFLIACTVMFILCYMGHKGFFAIDDYDGSSTFAIDKKAAENAIESGRYFGQFLVYVAVSYAAMLLKLRSNAKP